MAEPIAEVAAPNPAFLAATNAVYAVTPTVLAKTFVIPLPPVTINALTISGATKDEPITHKANSTQNATASVPPLNSVPPAFKTD
jgi:hypothetical protein